MKRHVLFQMDISKNDKFFFKSSKFHQVAQNQLCSNHDSRDRVGHNGCLNCTQTRNAKVDLVFKIMEVGWGHVRVKFYIGISLKIFVFITVMSGIVCCILDNDHQGRDDSQQGSNFYIDYIKMFFLLSNPLKNLLNMTIISSCFKKLSIKQKHFVCRKILKPFYTNIYFTTLSRFPVYNSIKLIIALCILLLR